MATATVLVCDGNRVPVAAPVRYTDLSVEPVFNAVGSGAFTAPATSALVAAVTTPGNTVTVVLDGEIFAGGPIEKPGAISWTPDDGTGTVKVNFATWEVCLGWRLTYPDPALAADAQVATAWSATAANAETIMRELVDTNAGLNALTDRRIPGLYLGDLAGVGTNIDLSTRFEPLTDVLRKAAAAGGGLGWRIRQTAGRLLAFEVYAPTDRSASVRFSRSLRNLVSLDTDPEGPTATIAIVGGDGTGGSRTIVERSNVAAVAAWGRIEKWVNQAGADVTTTGLEQAGDAALVDSGEQPGVRCVAVDGPMARYGSNYWLGDTVSVEVTPGVSVTDVVASVRLTATPDKGVVVSPQIGTDARTTTRQAQRVRDLERRLARLERS